MMSSQSAEIVARGCCHVYYALDIGFSVDFPALRGLDRRGSRGWRDATSCTRSGLPESPACSGSRQPNHRTASRQDLSDGG